MSKALVVTRIRRCCSCAFHMQRPSPFWRRSRCAYGCHNIDAKGDIPDALVLTTEAFLNGECPAGHWKDLEIADLEAEATSALVRKVENQRRKIGTMLASVLDGMPVAEKRGKLTTLVGRFGLLPEVAADIEQGLV